TRPRRRGRRSSRQGPRARRSRRGRSASACRRSGGRRKPRPGGAGGWWAPAGPPGAHAAPAGASRRLPGNGPSAFPPTPAQDPARVLALPPRLGAGGKQDAFRVEVARRQAVLAGRAVGDDLGFARQEVVANDPVAAVVVGVGGGRRRAAVRGEIQEAVAAEVE